MSDEKTGAATLSKPAEADAETHDDAHDEHEHDPYVAHHFESMEQQIRSAKLGMWVFLSTEILMFGGLFCAYAMWRRYYTVQFDIGHQYLDTMMGAFNTVVLIASSFTMAWAVRTAMLGKRLPTVILLVLTLLGGGVFMVVKYMEYSHKVHLGVVIGQEWGSWDYFKAAVEAGEAGDVAKDQVVPVAVAAKYLDAGAMFDVETDDEGNVIGETAQEQLDAWVEKWSAKQDAKLAKADAHHDDAHAHDTAHAGSGGHDGFKVDNHAYWYMVTPREAALRSKTHGFFSIYYAMTGLHGLHVLIGMGLIGWIAVRAWRNEFNAYYNHPVDIVGLYWHLVDLIWIFLFPLLYLIH